MSVFLKVKSKHLTEEAKIIRFEERKHLKRFHSNRDYHYASGSNDEYSWWYDKDRVTWWKLMRHRTWDVRNEQRATFIARAFLQGKPYNSVEHKRLDEPLFVGQILPRVLTMVNKYGKVKVEMKDLVEWSTL